MQDNQRDTTGTDLLLEILDLTRANASQVAEIKASLARIEGDHEYVKQVTKDAVRRGYNAGAAAKAAE